MADLEDSGTPHEEAPGPAAAKTPFAVVGMASSAGGLNALSEVLADLPADFPLPIVVVQHLDPRHRSLIADILERRTALSVCQAADGDRLRAGTVFVAPPNRHLLVGGNSGLSLSESELVHFVRPSADLLFESLAGSFREQTIAVVLSGSGVDGAMGVEAVKKMGGTVIVQEQHTAEFSGMPQAAIDTGAVDFVLPLPEIGPALTMLVKGDDRP